MTSAPGRRAPASRRLWLGGGSPLDPFTVPPAPDPKVPEWPGTPIGAGNTVTRTKGRTAVHDKTIDRIEGRRDELVSSAVEHIVRAAGKEPLTLQDVVIHGVRVCAITNSKQLTTFWQTNGYSPDGWRAQTGLEPLRVLAREARADRLGRTIEEAVRDLNRPCGNQHPLPHAGGAPQHGTPPAHSELGGAIRAHATRSEIIDPPGARPGARRRRQGPCSRPRASRYDHRSACRADRPATEC